MRNPNYLGDLFWATGWALASVWWRATWFPVMEVGIDSSTYRRRNRTWPRRYVREWPEYEARTVRLIPFVF